MGDHGEGRKPDNRLARQARYGLPLWPQAEFRREIVASSRG
jgi:hypothetical protein